MVDDEPAPISSGVSASLAVPAGVAAGDAACCSALGARSRGHGHNEAADVLERMADSADAVIALRRLLSLKNDAQRGLTSVSTAKRNSALRQARKLVEFAEQVIRR